MISKQSFWKEKKKTKIFQKYVDSLHLKFVNFIKSLSAQKIVLGKNHKSKVFSVHSDLNFCK